MHPIVSVCIPVYGSEPFLEACLKSVVDQEFEDFEIVICNDCSPGRDINGLDCKKIVRKIKKMAGRKFWGRINYIEHIKNKGIFETRRSLLYAAEGEYISYVDSDDLLLPGALKALFVPGTDISQGGSNSFYEKNGELQFVDIKKTLVYNGKLQEREIFDGFLLEHNHSGFLWAKIFRKELLIQVYENLPKVFCNFGEDFLIYFYASFYAKSYSGVSEPVYNYRINTGLSSNKAVTHEAQWKLIISASSLFSTIYSWVDEQNVDPENPVITPEEFHAIQQYAIHYLKSNIKHLRAVVVPEYKERAYELLCEYWGESFVKRVEKMIDSTPSEE